ncbi:unnamed protein product [Prorocentrum cordatum]|uniref:Reverse transcriptase domain-containing protein n=1 Tax=Prorocentrum cordatum TaxID=2364126 RepID=A0ABN9RZT3_9DINO|nr:unnamed protein product [Polarella glacialis]
MELARAEQALHRACTLKHPFIRRDKQNALLDAADRAQHAADMHDPRELYNIVRRLAGTSSKALATLTHEDGSVLDASQAVMARWRRHFTNLFRAGHASQIEDVTCLPAGAKPDPRPAAEPAGCAGNEARNLIEGLEIFVVIQSLDGSSGVGEDALSALIVKTRGWHAAEIMSKIIHDIIYVRHVPLVWRGGKLVVIYKGKGMATDPDNYRGILVSDHLAKILTSLLQAHLNATYEKAVGVSQYGAVKHRGTAMASLVVRSFLDLCSARSWSCFVLFVDLSKAFDYAIREVVMGWMPDASSASLEEKRALLEKLGVPERASHHLAEWIDKTGGLLALSGADPAVCELVTSLHHGAWFRLPRDEPYVVSVSGARQGCKLGALVFNMIYSLALLMLKQELLDLGIILWVTNAPSSAFWGTQTTTTSCAADERLSPVFEVTYVDDECIFLAASSARAMMLAIPKLMSCLCTAF